MFARKFCVKCWEKKLAEGSLGKSYLGGSEPIHNRESLTEATRPTDASLTPDSIIIMPE